MKQVKAQKIREQIEEEKRDKARILNERVALYLIDSILKFTEIKDSGNQRKTNRGKGQG